MKTKQSRILYFDILNIVAIIAVVAMHCNGIVHEKPTIRAWDTALIIECICYFAVPLFIMLSGATLLNYREKYDTKTFFKKRIFKVLIPFLFWVIIMFAFKIITKQLKIENFTSLTDWINAFFSNKEESTYYFMFDILGIYLTMPLLSLLAKKEYRKTLWLTVLLFFIFNAIVPNILQLFKITWNDSFSIRISGYVIIAFLGYLLSTEELTKKQRIILYISAIIGVFFRYFTTFFFSKETGQVIKTTWGYTQWHCILLTSAVFVFVKNLNLEKIQNNEKMVKIISQIANCSFGIYLIHMIVKYCEFKVVNISNYSWQYRTIGVLTTYLISLLIVYILKKIPIIKKIVP